MKRRTTETFGCETVRHSSTVERKLAKLGLRNPIAVPIRMKGLSSEGDLQRCITNVEKMVVRYGGKVVVGMSYKEGGELGARIGRHAVWITPEGKAVCITKANYVRGGDPIIYNSKMEECVQFIPLTIFTREEILSMLSEGTENYDWHVKGIRFMSSAKFGVIFSGEGGQDTCEILNAKKCVRELRKTVKVSPMNLMHCWLSGGDFLVRQFENAPKGYLAA